MTYLILCETSLKCGVTAQAMLFVHCYYHEVSSRIMLYTLQSNPSGMCTSTNLIDPFSIK